MLCVVAFLSPGEPAQDRLNAPHSVSDDRLGKPLDCFRRHGRDYELGGKRGAQPLADKDVHLMNARQGLYARREIDRASDERVLPPLEGT